MSDRPRLPWPIARVLKARSSPEAERRIWQRVDKRLAARRRRVFRLGWASGGAFAAACAALTVLLLWARESPAPLRLADGRAFEGLDVLAGAETARFDDGSSVEVMAGTSLTPLAMTPGETVLLLSRGKARFAVRPGGARRWIVEAGVLSVAVVGTEFVVERGDAEVRVTVSRGTVLVRSAALSDGVQRVGAGQSVAVAVPVEAGPRGGRARGASPAGDGGVAPEGASAELAESFEPPARVPAAAEARTRAPGGLARLLQRADAARLSGEDEVAMALLEQVISRYAGDPRAALSAFQLGVLREASGRYAAAEAAFGRALSLRSSNTLKEDCYLRQVQVQLKTSQHARAAQTAAAYRQRFPRGRHGAVLERLLAAAPERD